MKLEIEKQNDITILNFDLRDYIKVIDVNPNKIEKGSSFRGLVLFLLKMKYEFFVVLDDKLEMRTHFNNVMAVFDSDITKKFFIRYNTLLIIKKELYKEFKSGKCSSLLKVIDPFGEKMIETMKYNCFTFFFNERHFTNLNPISDSESKYIAGMFQGETTPTHYRFIISSKGNKEHIESLDKKQLIKWIN